ncbi:MAG: phosphoglycerate dehydrogenase [Filifactor alocis]|nr:phosphoglycerate dehydrogenase [Filifactor alocis]
MKALFSVDYGKEKFDKLRELGYEIQVINEGTIKEEDFPYDVDAYVCFDPFHKIDMDKFENLKLLQLTSIGFDFVPKDKIREKKIILTNNKGGYSIPMGEFIVFNLLQFAKNNRKLMKQQEEKRWKQDFTLTELYGKSVVFLGTGTISTEGAKRLQGFGMKVIGMNTKGTPQEYFDEVYPLDRYAEIFPKADYLICVLPLTDSTRYFLDKEKLSLLPAHANFINVSRGPLVKETDLVEVLQEGRIAGAALDVFEVEPLPEDSPLWEMEQVYLYPHTTWISEAMNDRRFELIYENLRRLKDGQELKNVVNLERGY